MPTMKKILIVDDNKINRSILCKILSGTYEVLEAENGKEALDLLRKDYGSISAVLLDIVMPVMDGYEVLENMGKDLELSKIPVIVTTGNEDQKSEERALSLGAHDFLLKPYKPAIILHRLANTIKLRETAALVNAIERDELTGVYSKEFFYKKAEARLNEGEDKKYDIVCMDIERFKLINDLFGVQTGDELLRYVAELMQDYVSDNGICGRIGADTFACMIMHREVYEDSLFKTALEKINRFPINITINVCYGIYVVTDLSVPINVMCDRALIACSSVKGKYGVHLAYYTDDFREAMLSEQVIVDSMKAAISEKQFLVYYQPKYDLATETIAGAEALVRWNHPEKGFMSPMEFIPLFERNGFIMDLDMYVWETVCRQIREWMDLGYSVVPVSVNVSRADIYNPELPKILLGFLKKYGLEPEILHLEITETAYTDNPEQIIGTVQKLRKLGFIIEMDDFGTGYSSLNMLSELPIHILKLDMKFIQSETSKKSHKNILSFIISLAKWLNLLVVAEGVETEKQVQTLKSMDCNYAQGYYFAKPLPVADFEKKLTQNCVCAKNTKKTAQRRKTNKLNIQKSNSDRVMVIVDDSEINRGALTEIFRGLYTIVEAENGKEALLYIKENYNEIDIVLLDLVMPVMDGFQMLEKLKKTDKLKNIPVIITSQTGDDSEAKALSMGAADFVSKPYSPEVALRRVSNVMAQSKLHMIERERELSREVEEMRYKAEHDCLTNLYNRTAIETMVNSFFANNKTADSTFMMLDIDHFKSVNDILGHDKGDELLKEISRLLLGAFRDNDVVARLGGDEFGVFIPSLIPLAELEERAGALCKKLEMDFEDVRISATIGMAISPLHGADYQTLYKHADSALLAAKRLGKNQFKIFDTEMEMPSPSLYRNMDWLLDETSDAIVICDIGSYEVLYLNAVAAKIAGMAKELCVGKKCYETLWGRTKPCEHCLSATKLTESYYQRQDEDPNTGRHYIIRDKLMEWGGKIARIQYIQDNTGDNLHKIELEESNRKLSDRLSALQGEQKQ